MEKSFGTVGNVVTVFATLKHRTDIEDLTSVSFTEFSEATHVQFATLCQFPGMCSCNEKTVV